jgi:hypothetical protein
VITLEENEAMIILKSKSPNAEDLRAKEDPGRRFPEGNMAKICAVGGKTLQEIVKEVKLRFEIPEARRDEGAEDHRSVGGHTSIDHELQV